jgi:hypothetical protein
MHLRIKLGIKQDYIFLTEISHEEVEHKNLFIFCYKNHLDRLSINTTQLIIKDLQRNFVQFSVPKLGKT